jgi:cell division protein FtsB
VLRYVALLLLILLLALEVKLWTGDWSLREVWRLRQRVAEQKQENQNSSSATKRCRPKCRT